MTSVLRSGVVIAALLVAGCASEQEEQPLPTDTVRTDDQAIAIGQKLCGTPRPACGAWWTPDATLQNGIWYVSAYYRGIGWSAEVRASDGNAPEKSCGIIVSTDD